MKSFDINKLSVEQRDRLDRIPYTLSTFTPREDERYFDDIDEYYAHLKSHVYPATRPWMADVARRHEEAHAKCMLLLGAMGVKYIVKVDRHGNTAPRSGAYVIPIGDGALELPNITFAAFMAAPNESSDHDTAYLRSYGYPNVDYLTERIHIWNELDNGLTIPLPGTLEEDSPRTT